ncbi:hypothetical protein [Halodesulfovibrio sp. MK-HDV]|jgi:hypothetical protein|uniref:hypothetical protein n=1 Tax=Halodesulfovibrio sp. MK-HDV TaxID=2599925 RepID=UPI00136C9B63|nr:hypothetical protein [Halodesulfovibrio sp. MK-HDV]KAF1076307.1 hypothetical protein MKHDV_01328 [Halodesulfovibrio sp. MK-HDV]
MQYSLQDKYELNEKLRCTTWQYSKMLSLFRKVSERYPETKEYSFYGFLRRLKLIQRCIQKTFSIFPIELTAKLSGEDNTDLEIYIHSALINIYGALDNIAWTWVVAMDVKGKNETQLKGMQVGLGKNNKYVRDSLPDEILLTLEKIDRWNKEFLSPLRHACAHKCPPYIPPSCLSTEDDRTYRNIEEQINSEYSNGNFNTVKTLYAQLETLGSPAPYLIPSFAHESEPVMFHKTILDDWNKLFTLSCSFADYLLTVPYIQPE